MSAWVVHAGALRYSFSQDDFAWLARAAGLLPRLDGPWRWLSQQAYFDVGRLLFGLEPWPYHAASLAVHAICAVLVLVFLRRWVSLPAATVGAAFFATHPTVYTAIYWIAAIGDPLALGFGLATLLLASRGDAWRWAALPTFALSLLAKESTLLLPGFLLGMRLGLATDSRSSRNLRIRDPVLLLLLAIATGFGIWLVAFGGSGAPAQREVDQPYFVGLGPHLGLNFVTYAGWSIHMLVPFVKGFTDAIDREAFGWGGALILLWLLGCASRTLRARGWLLAGLYFLLLLLPVLPLRNHTYHYYGYAALPGIAWMAAALFEAVFVRDPHAARRMGPIAGLVVIGLLTVNGSLLVRKIETAPLGNGPLRADPTVDRALVMDRVAAGLERAELPPGTRLLFWSPARLLSGSPVEAPDTYWEKNVRAATVEGLAVRVLFPQVREVRFVKEVGPVEADVRYAVFGVDGRTDVFTWSVLDSMIRPPPATP